MARLLYSPIWKPLMSFQNSLPPNVVGFPANKNRWLTGSAAMWCDGEFWKHTKLQVSLLVNIAAGLYMYFDVLALFLLILRQFSRYWAEISAPCLLWAPGPESYETRKSVWHFNMYKMIPGCIGRRKANVYGLTTLCTFLWYIRSSLLLFYQNL